MTKPDLESLELRTGIAKLLNRYCRSGREDDYGYGPGGTPATEIAQLVEQHYANKSPFTVVNYDPKHPPPAGFLQGVKPLTDDDQQMLEYIRTYRTRNPGGTTQIEMDFLLALADRLPREPRKKTLGQVLYEAKRRPGIWPHINEADRAEWESAAQAVVDEYVLRTRGEK